MDTTGEKKVGTVLSVKTNEAWVIEETKLRGVHIVQVKEKFAIAFSNVKISDEEFDSKEEAFDELNRNEEDYIARKGAILALKMIGWEEVSSKAEKKGKGVKK